MCGVVGSRHHRPAVESLKCAAESERAPVKTHLWAGDMRAETRLLAFSIAAMSATTSGLIS